MMVPQFVRKVRVLGIFFAGTIGCFSVAGTRGLAVDFLHEGPDVGRSAACTLTSDVAVKAAAINTAGNSFFMAYSHSIVAGGLDVTSRTTRLTP